MDLRRSRFRPRAGIAVIFVSAALVLSSLAPVSAATSRTTRYAVKSEHRTAAAVVHVRVADAVRLAARHPRKAPSTLPLLTRGLPRGSKHSSVPAVPNLELSRHSMRTDARLAPDVAPDPLVATSFAGLTSSDQADYVEPANPWVGVNGSYVIESLNSLVRISTRSGTAVQTLPTWALFALPPDQAAADPRISWDAGHGRWVGVLSSHNDDYSENHLVLLVSATADPLGIWDVHSIDFGNLLPTLPALASSSDRIVLTSDDFADLGSGLEFVEQMILVVAWSSILNAGAVEGSLGFEVFPNSSGDFFHGRPAQPLSSSTEVHVVMEFLNGADRDAYYLRIGGPATAPNIVAESDLTQDLGIAPFTDPIAPRNADGTPIAEAVPGGPTDVVWQNGRLWWVSTYAWDSGGSVFYDAARATSVVTTPTVPTAPTDLGFEDPGFDLYAPGIGVTQSGTAILPTTVSSDPNDINPSSIAFRWTALDGPSVTSEYNVWGEAPYGGTRWADHVGVATDPSGADAVWVAGQAATPGGEWKTNVLRIVVDQTSPTVTAPTLSLIAPSTLNSSVQVKLAWTGSDAGSGVRYRLEQNVDGHGWQADASTTSATSLIRSLPFHHNIQYRVTAIDGGGNTTTATGPRFAPYLIDQTAGSVSYTGSWTSYDNANYSGGTVRASGIAGASASFAASNARSLAFVTTKATNRGSFKVYIDGVFKKIVSATGSTAYRQILYQQSWSTPGTHRIKIVVSGTAGHPRIDVDAFIALRFIP